MSDNPSFTLATRILLYSLPKVRGLRLTCRRRLAGCSPSLQWYTRFGAIIRSPSTLSRSLGKPYFSYSPLKHYEHSEGFPARGHVFGRVWSCCLSAYYSCQLLLVECIYGECCLGSSVTQSQCQCYPLIGITGR